MKNIITQETDEVNKLKKQMSLVFQSLERVRETLFSSFCLEAGFILSFASHIHSFSSFHLFLPFQFPSCFSQISLIHNSHSQGKKAMKVDDLGEEKTIDLNDEIDELPKKGIEQESIGILDMDSWSLRKMQSQSMN